jgi:aldose 1-epimerase
VSSSIRCRTFGTLDTGASVQAWTLRGSGGAILEVITYGATVTRLLLPDKNGHLADVVLGFDLLEHYLGGHPYVGSIVGRVAGRISGAAFHLQGRHYSLVPNDPPNHLHGGVSGFHRKNWIAVPVAGEDDHASVQLYYRSPDGEEGYPGNLDVWVTYSLTEDNALSIDIEAITDRTTPVNIASHCYFNLAGEGSGSILNHELQVLSDHFVPADHHLTLSGQTRPVAASGEDFRCLRNLGQAVDGLFQNHGSLYLLRRSDFNGHQPSLAAQLAHPQSGRVMTVSTTERFLQLYTGSRLNGTWIGKSGKPYLRYAGACLECHGYPDGITSPQVGSILLEPRKRILTNTTYTFSLLQERQ